MKTFRLFAALLVVALCFPPAFSQETGDFASLLAKARRGNGIAQYNLGLAYAEGKGTAVDPMEAYVWLSLARENGARGRALDTLMGDLDKQSLEQAQRRLAERKAELGVRTPTTVNVRSTTATPAPAPKAPTTVPKESASAPKPPAPTVTPPPATTRSDDSVASLKAERDALTAQLAKESAEVTALRADRERIMALSAGHEKTARTATETNLALQERTRVAEAKAAELTLANDTAKGELARVRLALTAAQKGAKPAPDPAAIEQKNRELQAALNELETSRTFGQQVENTLNTVAEQKSALESTLRTTEAARDSYAREYETAKAQIVALENQVRLAAIAAAKPAAPSYPDLSSRVAELEAQLAVARQPTTPAYPNLSGKVSELEAKVATLTADANRAKQEAVALTQAKEAAEKSLAAKPAAPAYPDLSGKVAELQTQLAQAKSAAPAYPDQRMRVTELETALAKAKADAAQQAAALTQSNESSLRALSLELAAAKTALAKANDSLSAKSAAPAYPDLSGKVTELEAALASQSAETARAKQEAAAMAKTKDDALQKVATTEQTRAELAKQFEDYKSTTAAVQRERTTLLANVKMLESEKTSLRRQAESAGAEAAQLRTQVATLKEQHSALSSETERAKQEAAALTKAMQEKAAYPDLRPRVTELESALASQSAETARARQEAVALAKAKDDALQQVAATTQSSEASLRTLSVELVAAKAELAKATDSLKAKPIAPAYPDLTKQVQELTAETKRLRAESDNLQQSLAGAERQSAELAARTARVAELEAQVGRLQASLAAVPAAPSYPNLSDKVSELEARVANLTADANRAKQEAVTLTQAKEAAEKSLAAKPAAPAYPDLSGKVAELQALLAQAKSAAPSYPDLSPRVAELEAQLAKSLAAKSAAPAYPDLSVRVTELTNQVTQLREDRERMQKMLADTGRQLRNSTADASRIKELEARVATLSSDLSAAAAAKTEAEKQMVALTKAKTEAEAQSVALQATLARPPPGPAYPDLSGRVAELEAQLSTAAKQRSAPAYPDLSNRVSELENALASTSRQLRNAQEQLAQAASQPPAPVAAPVTDTSELEKRLAETEGRLTTALRGYALLEKDRDAQQSKFAQVSDALANEKSARVTQVAALTAQVEQLQSAAAAQASAERAAASLTAEKDALNSRLTEMEARAQTAQAEADRLGESLAALQRSTGQSAGEVASAKALVKQLQGANAVLAQENYQLKTALARTTGSTAATTTVSAQPAASRTHVVVAGDTLSKISLRYFGTAARWQEIYNANSGQLGPNGILRVGTELRIP